MLLMLLSWLVLIVGFFAFSQAEPLRYLLVKVPGNKIAPNTNAVVVYEFQTEYSSLKALLEPVSALDYIVNCPSGPFSGSAPFPDPLPVNTPAIFTISIPYADAGATCTIEVFAFSLSNSTSFLVDPAVHDHFVDTVVSYSPQFLL